MIRFRFHSDRAADSISLEPVGKIVEQLASQRFGLLVGPHGSGKSTLLQTLMPHLQDRFPQSIAVSTHAGPSALGWSRFMHAQRVASDVRRHQDQLDSAGLLIVDGMEQLSTADRWRLWLTARRKHQFILGTSHQALRPFVTLFQTKVTASLIESLTESLLADCPGNLSNSVLVELRQRDLTRLSDVRQLWFELYDVAESARRRCSSTPFKENARRWPVDCLS